MNERCQICIQYDNGYCLLHCVECEAINTCDNFEKAIGEKNNEEFKHDSD